MGARDTALAVLLSCRRQDAWSDGALKEQIRKDKLDRRDAALASRLCYGVLQNRALLDFWLEGFVKGGMRKLSPAVQDILRLAALQITQMDRVPDSAAVNCAVEQTKRLTNPRAAGLVNGVLRNLIRQKQTLPLPSDLATRYSHPQPLVELLTQAVGREKIEPLLAADNEAPAMTVQVNTLQTSAVCLQQSLTEQNVKAQLHPWLPDCLILSGTGNLECLPQFQNGQFYVQDAAARLPVLCAEIRPGMRVLDCCAAPGGKSIAAAIAMKNQGELFSCDIHEHKIRLLQLGAERLGISILHPKLQDASAFAPEWEESMDVVLADVPCSGLGVIRKKPDIRYKDLTSMERLPQLQRAILENQARYVKPGGVLLYSTCTIVPRENEDVANEFLQNHPEFTAEPLKLPPQLGFESTAMATLLPCDHQTDGFFLCKMRRKA